MSICIEHIITRDPARGNPITPVIISECAGKHEPIRITKRGWASLHAVDPHAIMQRSICCEARAVAVVHGRAVDGGDEANVYFVAATHELHALRKRTMQQLLPCAM